MGVVDDVRELSSKTEPHSLRDVQVLVDSKVDIVRAWGLQSVSADVGEGSDARPNVLSIRILRHIGHNITGVRRSHCRERGYVGPYPFFPRGIDDGSITRRVNIEVGVSIRLYSNPLSRFKRIHGAELPVADYVFHEPVPIPEDGRVIDHGKGEPLRTVER